MERAYASGVRGRTRASRRLVTRHQAMARSIFWNPRRRGLLYSFPESGGDDAVK